MEKPEEFFELEQTLMHVLMTKRPTSFDELKHAFDAELQRQYAPPFKREQALTWLQRGDLELPAVGFALPYAK
jgi:hypothetical protein